MVAIDLDEGLNGQVTYQMRVGMPRMDFIINSTTGLVTSTAMLDREKISEYYLRVVASDAGSPSKSSTSTLTVRGNCQLILHVCHTKIRKICSTKYSVCPVVDENLGVLDGLGMI